MQTEVMWWPDTLIETGSFYKELRFSNHFFPNSRPVIKVSEQVARLTRSCKQIHKPQKQSGTNYCLLQTHRPLLRVRVMGNHMWGGLENRCTLAVDLLKSTVFPALLTCFCVMYKPTLHVHHPSSLKVDVLSTSAFRQMCNSVAIRSTKLQGSDNGSHTVKKNDRKD